MNPLERLARASAARPVPVLAALIVLAVGAGALALGLGVSAGTDTLVSRGTDSAQATALYREKFGEDAIVVLVQGDVQSIVDSADLGRLIRLEGCLGGNVPAGRSPYGTERQGGRAGACWELARLKPVKAVYGPGTFLFEATEAARSQLNALLQQGREQALKAASDTRRAALARGFSRAQADRLAAQAAAAEQGQVREQLTRLALQTGVSSVPRIDDPRWINQIVFDPAKGANVPKPRFAYLFPNPRGGPGRAAVIQVRLKPGLSDSERSHAIDLVRSALGVTDAKGTPLFALQNGGYRVSGVPVVVAGLAKRVTSSIAALLLGALAIMALTLALAFRTRVRLLPLAVALAAAGLTFGLLRIAGATLTMASVAVLPVLIGLSVDYAVQFQSRVAEAGGDVARGAAAGAPTIGTAGLATGVGFLVLLLSPVPMVRGFGALLVLGIALALVCTFAGAAAALSLLGRRAPGPLETALGRAELGAREIVRTAPGVRELREAGPARRLFSLATRHPERMLAVGLALAVLGWVVDTRAHVESDVTKLVPSDLPALRDVSALQRATGIAGEIDVLVSAQDVSDPKVVAWMTSYQQSVLRRLRYTEKQGCGTARLCPALSLPDLFRTDATPASAGQVRRLLATVPPYFSQAVVTADRKEANIAFGIRLMPLAQQQDVIDAMRSELHPPAGVSARLAGLPVLAAEANAKLASPWRRLATLLLGLLAVGVALGAAFRNTRRALVPLVPIALATGWSALVLLPVTLNPMSATLGALVIAISTEFSVLLSERFRSERAAGHALDAALARAYRSTGAAVLVSGITAIAGFGVLVLSDIRMLQGFGLVTVIDLAVALLGVGLVLPAVLVLDERDGFHALARRARTALAPRRRRGPARIA